MQPQGDKKPPQDLQIYRAVSIGTEDTIVKISEFKIINNNIHVVRKIRRINNVHKTLVQTITTLFT